MRTTPAHGTAYNIAGKNKANPKSLIDAMFAAYDIYMQRKKIEQVEPLQKQEQTDE